MKILFNTHLALDYPEKIQRFARRFPEHNFKTTADKEELRQEIDDTDVLVDHRISTELLDAAPLLKWIFVPFTGVNRLPLEECSRRGIRVSNNHGNARFTAERGFSLALALLGRIVEFDQGLRRGYWHRNESVESPFILWDSLFEKRIAILGTGAIGRGIAGLAAPFGGEISGFRRSTSKPAPKEFSRVTSDLQSCLAEADLVFISLPLTKETRGMIGPDELALLKDSYLVNMSRAEIVEEEPLFEALEQKRLKGAALDVWYRNPKPFASLQLPSRFPFHELENVVLSPHAGSHTAGGKEGQLTGTLENLEALLKTGTPPDVVDLAQGY